jgi:hypothetical protein
MKKCPICYSILPPKVIFCPVCGTELQTQVSENQENPKTPAHHSFHAPSQKPVFRDEPVETTTAKKDEFKRDTQYAWKLTDSIIPLQMKGQINYSDVFKPVRMDFKIIKKMNLLDFLMLGSLSLVSAILLLIQVGLVGVLVFNLVTSIWIVPSLLIVSLVLSSVSSYVLNQKTAVILEKKEEIGFKVNKKSFLSYLPLQIIHLTIIGLIVAAGYGVVKSISSVINPTIAIYALAFILVVIISIVSPPLRISKILNSLRESSVMQNLHDASHFPKLSLKRSLELIGFTFLLPSVFVIASLNFIIEASSSLFSPALETSISTWSIFLFVIMLILLTVNFAFVSLNDVRTYAYYEKLLLDYVEPPDIDWIKNQETAKSIGKSSGNEEDSFSNFPEGEELCPTCSTMLIEDAEFCTDCGTKVTR